MCGSGKTRQGGQFTATAGLQRRIKRHLAWQQSQTIFQRGWTAKISWSLSGCNVRRLWLSGNNLLLIKKVHNGSPSVTPGKQPRLDYGKWKTLRNTENNLTSTSPSLCHQMTNSFQPLAMASRLTATSRLASEELRTQMSSVFTDFSFHRLQTGQSLQAQLWH